MSNTTQLDPIPRNKAVANYDVAEAEGSTHVIGLNAGELQSSKPLACWARTAAPFILFVLTDLLAILASSLVAALLTQTLIPAALNGTLGLFVTLSCVMLLAYGLSGLYANVGRNGPKDIKRMTQATTLSMLIMALAVYASGNLFAVNPVILPIVWICALFIVPMARAFLLSRVAHRSWWGHKALIISKCPETAEQLMQNLQSQSNLGIKPQGILLIDNESPADHAPGIPQLHGPDSVLKQAAAHGIQYAIIAMSDLKDQTEFELLQRYEDHFKHWLIVPGAPQHYSLWVRARDLSGLLGLELTNRLNTRARRFIKRSMDLALTLIGGLCILPFCALLALAIKMESKGPVLYSQVRLGKNGKAFKAWKFRSMVSDADKALNDLLERRPELQKEWETHQKIKDDPRVTRVGKVLRGTSLDELPQLINVLRGDMSLVGPRPCMRHQIALYGQVWHLYKRTRPGMTGQWQVSGRNETSYEQRAAMDAYYVRNWSVWLDIHILARTFAVVFKREGAY